MAEIGAVIKIPESIWVAIQNGEYCGIIDDRTYNAIKKGTPLPEHHGRLIDADWVKNTLDLYTLNFDGTYKQFIRRSDIDTVPTIIEGSDSE